MSVVAVDYERGVVREMGSKVLQGKLDEEIREKRNLWDKSIHNPLFVNQLH